MNFKVIISILFALSLFQAGCLSQQAAKADHQIDSRLTWCIEQVNQGKIYRNMPLNELKGIFKEKLLGEGLTPNGERYFSSILDKDYSPSDGPRQFARTWIIEFKVSKSDRVTDYSITMSGEQ